MKLHLVGLTILGMFLTTLSTSAQHYNDSQMSGVPLTKADIQRMLPSGKLRVDVMDFERPPKHMEDLMNKMSASIARYPKWRKAHIKELAQTYALAPFSPKLGLTQSEYAEITAYLGKGSKLVKRGEGVITVQAHGDIIDLEGQTNTSFLTNVQIHLTENQVSTPYGTLEIVPPLKPNAHPYPGSLNGNQWERITGTPATLLTRPKNTSHADLVVAKNLDGKSGVLKYYAGKHVNGRQMYFTILILQFPLSR
ncbi:MAG: hypothetical protein JWN14_2678 [Chthonomonadales bacterium]|nr:hypothetical protein [Chthonomonadales bacterium]